MLPPRRPNRRAILVHLARTPTDAVLATLIFCVICVADNRNRCRYLQMVRTRVDADSEEIHSRHSEVRVRPPQAGSLILNPKFRATRDRVDAPSVLDASTSRLMVAIARVNRVFKESQAGWWTGPPGPRGAGFYRTSRTSTETFSRLFNIHSGALGHLPPLLRTD